MYGKTSSGKALKTSEISSHFVRYIDIIVKLAVN